MSSGITWRPAFPLPPVNTILLPPDAIANDRLAVDERLLGKLFARKVDNLCMPNWGDDLIKDNGCKKR